ncbi:hypothetical protein HK405_015468 [Cladochytrium tenue]|nr:hypothetical protein HK405_015468 [Cladochytrium tenue]
MLALLVIRPVGVSSGVPSTAVVARRWPARLLLASPSQSTLLLRAAARCFSRVSSPIAPRASPLPHAAAAFDVLPDVRAALDAGRPVVALESTIVAHGMPYPQNVTTARAVEDLVRSAGAVPATIAIMDGSVKVGLQPADLERLARAGPIARKASRRDLALLLASGGMGATTVSGTMAIAHRVGISVFVTGGIGGVHRDGQDSMDISADLTELGRTPVAVVCAGVKSILDIGRTLEYLETQGVPVVTYGADEFPAFFTPKSGFQSPSRLDTPEDCAALLFAQNRLGLESGILISVPIPEEEAAIDGAVLNAAISDAIARAAKQKIVGKDITPFLLDEVKNLTQGKSLEANIALVKNNARVGADIAVSFSKMRTTLKIAHPSQTDDDGTKLPVVIGGTVLDVTSKFDDANPLAGTSSAGKVYQSLGGVARNVAESCFRTGGKPILVSAVGDDLVGNFVVSEMAQIGMNVERVERVPDRKTATYSATLNGHGEMLHAVADMAVLHEIGRSEAVRAEISTLFASRRWFAIDGNLDAGCCAEVLRAAARSGSFAYPGLEEASNHLSALFDCQIVKLGADGVLVVLAGEPPGPRSGGSPSPEFFHLPPPIRLVDCFSVTGAGDTYENQRAVNFGQRGAAKSLMTPEAVSPDLSEDL